MPISLASAASHDWWVRWSSPRASARGPHTPGSGSRSLSRRRRDSRWGSSRT